MLVLSLSHILTYAPSLVYEHASIKEKTLAKMLRPFPLLFVMLVLSLSHILTYAPSLVYEHASIKEKLSQKCFD